MSSAEQLERYLHELRSRADEARLRGARGVRAVLAREARELAPDALAKLLGALARHALELVHAYDAHDRQAGVLVVEALLDTETDEDATKLGRCATCLRRVFEHSADGRTLALAARALGRLARVGGSITADFVEAQLRLSLDWLDGAERADGRTLAAALALRELADHAPTLFAQHVGGFLARLWRAVYDPRAQVRDAAVAALAACLRLIGARSAAHAAQWHRAVADEVLAGARGQRAGGSAESIDGALCALGELLRHRCDHLREPAAYGAVCALARELFATRDRLVRRALVALVPRLAQFATAEFFATQLTSFFPFVLGAARAPNAPEARAHALEAAGELALLVGGAPIAPYLPDLLAACADALPRKPTAKRPYLLEGVACVGRLCVACGPAMSDALAGGLLEGMLHAGLTPQLVEALLALCARVPALAPRARAALLYVLAVTLTGRPSSEWLDAPDGGSAGAPAELDGLVADERDVFAAAAGAQPHVGAPAPPSGAGGGVPLQLALAPSSIGGGAAAAWRAPAAAHSAALMPVPVPVRQRSAMAAGGGAGALPPPPPPPPPPADAAVGWAASLGWAAPPPAADVAGGGGAAGGGGEPPPPPPPLAGDPLGLSSGPCGLTALPPQLLTPGPPHAGVGVDSGCWWWSAADGGGGGGDDGVGTLAAPACEPAERRTRIALRTMGAFPWPPSARHAHAGGALVPLFAAAAARYLDDARAPVRAEAVLACYWQLARGGARARAHAHELVSRLVTVGVADTDAHVRALTLRVLSLALGAELGRARALRSLLLALNDEELDVRVAAVHLVARAAPYNPAVVMPILRRTLLQLVTDVGAFGEGRALGGSVRVLGGLLAVAAPWMTPYTRPVLDVLRPRLTDADPAVAAAALRTVGSLVDAGGVRSAEDVVALCPPVLAALSDPSCAHKRGAALALLTRLVRASAQLRAVLDACPRLVSILIGHLKAEREPAARAELIQAVGVLGALDPRATQRAPAGGAGGSDKPPHAQRLRHGGGGGGAVAAGASGALADGAGAPAKGARGAHARAADAPGTRRADSGDADGGADGGPDGNPYAHLGPPDAFSKVAIDALTAMLRDPALAAHQLAVIGALTAIFERLRQHALFFVADVLPLLLSCVRAADAHVRDGALERIVAFVRTIGAPIRPFAPALLALVDDCWDLSLPHAIALVEALACALKEYARAPLQTLVPKLLAVLHADGTDARAPALHALRALRSLGGALAEHARALVPALSGLAEASAAPLGARAAALRTLAWLSRDVSYVEHASRIAQPCMRLLHSGPRELHADVCNCLALLALQMGDSFVVFAMAIQLTLNANQIEHAPYARVVRALLCGARPPSFAAVWDPVRMHFAAQGDALDGRGGDSGGGGGCTPTSGGGGSTVSLAAELASATALGLSDAAHGRGGGLGGGGGACGDGEAADVPLGAPVPRLPVNELALQQTWQTTERSTAEDWAEWMRRLSIELLRESPSPALRACAPIASLHPPLARAVFNSGFVSCWTELRGEYRALLIASLETALGAEGMPHDVLQLLLGLAECMEHDDRQLPIGVRQLGDLAMRCHAYAQALHYKELEFEAAASASHETVEAVEALITINHQLQQPEAARGVIARARRQHGLALDEGWHERLQRWDDALGAYDRRLAAEPSSVEALVGRARCLHALGEWRLLLHLAADRWPVLDEGARAELAPYAAAAAWHAADMVAMRTYVAAMGTSAGTPAVGTDGAADGGGGGTAAAAAATAAATAAAAGGAHADTPFFRAALAVHARDHLAAAAEIRLARAQLDPTLTSLIGESYTRAFRAVVRAQQLAELEEVSAVQQQLARSLVDAGGVSLGPTGVVDSAATLTAGAADSPLGRLKRLWDARLALCQRDVDALQQLLAVRRMVLPPRQDARTWLKLASSARKAGRLRLSHDVLTGLLTPPLAKPADERADDELAPPLGARLAAPPLVLPPIGPSAAPVDLLVRYAAAKHMRAAGDAERAHASLSELARMLDADGTHAQLASRCWRKVGEWLSEELSGAGRLELAVSESLVYLQRATTLDPSSYKAWHRWATLNFQGAELDHRNLQRTAGRQSYMRFSVGQSLEEPLAAPRRLAALPPLAAPARALALAPAGGFGGARARADALEARADAGAPAGEGRCAGGGALGADRAPLLSADDAPGAAQRALPLPPQPPPSLPMPAEAVTADVASRRSERERLSPYVVPAVNAFFRSISLGGHESLQDLLRLLTLWFRHGGHPEVSCALEAGFESVPVDTWLAVVPQVIARLDTRVAEVRRLVQQLLSRIALEHPQAFIYPLTVASCDTQSLPRKRAAETVLAAMARSCDTLVAHARLVSSELMRVAILLPELWVEAIEEASRRYFGQQDAAAMIAALRPVHALMAQGAQTDREAIFHAQYGLELDEAAGCLARYEQQMAEHADDGTTPRGAERSMERAWELYYRVLQRISKQLAQLHTLHLAHVSPALHEARDLVLAVPGTYRAGQPVACIRAFRAELTVISSKQRPRKLEVHGDDGLCYSFLLKGHEDLRQDERVMQLIGLVNQLLAADRSSELRPSGASLCVSQYAVVPLSPNSGLIGWVVHCDTLHALIREYREARKILLTIEHRLMLQMAPDYELCTLMQKVETFSHALESTNGHDLQRVLWLKSSSSEEWLHRRSTYTRSLGVMSMVGYVLGLGDRHPSNLMLHRVTGAVIHIDFGDCFEVAMQRDKYPERIPFRLTRMLTSAMEVGAVDGLFRATCVGAMGVLRRHKDSVMAMLEAFVHDPLVNWRLVPHLQVPQAMEPADSTQMEVARLSACALESSSPCAELVALDEEEEEEDARDDDEQPPALPRARATNLRPRSSSNSQPISARQGSAAAGRLTRTPLLAEASEEGLASVALSTSVVSASRRHNPPAEHDEREPEKLAAKAIAVMRRVHSKLTGRDFAPIDDVAAAVPLDVVTQVDRLIEAATSKENLCQCYIGWCPFW